MSNTKFFSVLAIIVIVVIGGALLLTRDGAKKDDIKPANVAAVTKTDHVQGADDAAITLIEYGDFQCPYCGVLHPILKEVLPEYKGQIRFVFRHFPITSIHPNSLVAHKAAEAAGKQGKFWEMYDRLYENQEDWNASSEPIKLFKDYAKALKLDAQQFQKDFDSTKTTNTINNVKSSGTAAGVESTPTLFVNGKKIDVPRSAEELRQKLDETLKNIDKK